MAGEARKAAERRVLVYRGQYSKVVMLVQGQELTYDSYAQALEEIESVAAAIRSIAQQDSANEGAK